MLIATLLACVTPPPPQDVVAPPAAPVPEVVAVVAPVVAPVVAVVAPEVPPDFTLTDRNPKSPGNGQPVSPKDYVGGVAGYYFTHAT